MRAPTPPNGGGLTSWSVARATAQTAAGFVLVANAEELSSSARVSILRIQLDICHYILVEYSRDDNFPIAMPLILITNSY